MGDLPCSFESVQVLWEIRIPHSGRVLLTFPSYHHTTWLDHPARVKCPCSQMGQPQHVSQLTHLRTQLQCSGRAGTESPWPCTLFPQTAYVPDSVIAILAVKQALWIRKTISFTWFSTFFSVLSAILNAAILPRPPKKRTFLRSSQEVMSS